MDYESDLGFLRLVFLMRLRILPTDMSRSAVLAFAGCKLALTDGDHAIMYRVLRYML